MAGTKVSIVGFLLLLPCVSSLLGCNSAPEWWPSTSSQGCSGFNTCFKSTFEWDNEEWVATNGHLAEQHSMLGNGYLQVVSTSQCNWGFVAPSRFQGDKTLFYGSVLNYQICSNATINTERMDDIIIRGEGLELVLALEQKPATCPEWEYICVALISGDVAWRIRAEGSPAETRGMPASEADIKRVLQWVKSIYIRGHHSTDSTEVTRIDDVQFCDGVGASRPCPNGCSGHGVCAFGSCSCNYGWLGNDCSMKDETLFTRFRVPKYKKCWNPEECGRPKNPRIATPAPTPAPTPQPTPAPTPVGSPLLWKPRYFTAVLSNQSNAEWALVEYQMDDFARPIKRAFNLEGGALVTRTHYSRTHNVVVVASQFELSASSFTLLLQIIHPDTGAILRQQELLFPSQGSLVSVYMFDETMPWNIFAQVQLSDTGNIRKMQIGFFDLSLQSVVTRVYPASAETAAGLVHCAGRPVGSYWGTTEEELGWALEDWGPKLTIVREPADYQVLADENSYLSQKLKVMFPKATANAAQRFRCTWAADRLELHIFSDDNHRSMLIYPLRDPVGGAEELTGGGYFVDFFFPDNFLVQEEENIIA